MIDTAFNHLSADKSDLYTAIMAVFTEAKAHFVVHLRPEDVAARLPDPPPLEEIQAALAQLAQWGNLGAEPDTSRVTTVEDFYRARHLYRISHRGEAVEAALAAYRRVLRQGGALQSVALDDIRTQLRALAALAEEDTPDPARVHLVLRDLARVSADLAENARAFMAGLGRTLDRRNLDRDAFMAFKGRLIDYLERFISDLVNTSGEIAGLIERLDGPPIDHLLHLVAQREADDEAPALDPSHPGQAPDRAARVAQTLDQWRGHWRGLGEWFLGRTDHPSQASLLRARARKAITQLLELAMLLNERRLGRSDRGRDFRTLARWFLECPQEADAHRLWRAAFALAPARHLGLAPETLDQERERPIPPSTPWGQAPPQRLSPRLRTTGRYERRGAPAKVRDRGAQRQKLAALMAQQAAQITAARRRLATGRPTRLSELGRLDGPEFGLFLRLLSDVLSALRPGANEARVQTSDGSLEVILRPLAHGEARIETPAGIFEGRDHEILIRDLGVEEEA